MRIVHARLSEGDLARWRLVCARRDALDDNPRAFDREESVRVHLEYFETSGQLYRDYDVPADEYAAISPHTGEIFWDD